MRLVRVERNHTSACKVLCCRCGAFRREVESFADIEGKPGDFYCQSCTFEINPAVLDVFIFAKEG